MRPSGHGYANWNPKCRCRPAEVLYDTVGGEPRLFLPPHIPRLLVLPQPNKAGVPQVVIGRDLQELELPHQHRPQPLALLHPCRRQPHTPPAALGFRQVGELALPGATCLRYGDSTASFRRSVSPVDAVNRFKKRITAWTSTGEVSLPPSGPDNTVRSQGTSIQTNAFPATSSGTVNGCRTFGSDAIQKQEPKSKCQQREFPSSRRARNSEAC